MAHRFSPPPHEDAQPILDWLLPKKPASNRYLVVGGQLRRELERAGKEMRRLLKEFADRGRLYAVEDESVDQETVKVQAQLDKNKIIDADDPHILALARLSGSRLPFTQDSRSRLIDLFRDRDFLDPPGKIYKSKANRDLLKNSKKCKDLRDSKKQRP
jgi:hypothetical protein